MSVGSELKHAREREGMSAEHIAERTKVPLYKIEALEEGRFENLPDDIYLDGIIRAYAREVSLDAEPLVQQSHDERATGDDWAIDLERIIRKDPPAPSLTGPSFLPPERFTSDNAGSWPLGSKLALALVTLIAVAGWGAYFYGVMLRGDRAESIPLSASTEPPPSADVASARDAGGPQEDRPIAPAVPPASPQPQGASTSEARADNAAAPSRRDEAATAGTTPTTRATTPATPPPRPAVPPAAASRPAVPAAAAPPPAATASNTPAAAPPRNVSGTWNLITHVESTSVAQVSDMRLGYQIELKQTGDQVSGTGRKITENGASIGSQAQTAISLTGTIAGDRLTLTFTENGAEGDSQGKFVLLADEGTLRGRFSTTAAQSSGTVEAHRAAGTR
jgi:cytoskeletal protein RodZ